MGQTTGFVSPCVLFRLQHVSPAKKTKFQILVSVLFSSFLQILMRNNLNKEVPKYLCIYYYCF